MRPLGLPEAARTQPRDGVWALGLALLALVSSASLTHAQPVDVAAEAPVPPPPSAPPRWDWIQTLAAPRIGARLTAVAVDPTNPDKIYVGAQSGVLFFSEDGGITWRELEPDAFTENQRDVIPPSTATPSPDRCPGDVCVDPEYTLPLPPLTPFIGPSIPDPLFSFGIRRSVFEEPALVEELLGNAIQSRASEEVRRIVVCPGFSFPLLVATRSEILGSTDEGLTWIRLLRFPRPVATNFIACDPTTVDHVVVATDVGFYESMHGGIDLNPDLSGLPRVRADVVAFDQEGGLYVSEGAILYRRRTAPGTAPRWVYPDFADSRTLPWERIQWIQPVGDDVWLGTQDGLRRSIDGGARWAQIAPNLFSRQVIGQVELGRNEAGGERVAVIMRDCPRDAVEPAASGCRSTSVMSTDDGGATWDPFFGVTRRSIQQMAYAQGRWFIVTGGELWQTAVATPGATPSSTQRWAERALSHSPSLSTTIEVALENLELDPRRLDSLVSGAYASGWLPSTVQLIGQGAFDASAGATSQTITAPFDRSGASSGASFSVFVQATWSLDQSAGQQALESSLRGRLYALRQQLSFAVEDAWHERQLQLQRLRRGMADPYQAAVIRERVNVLDAVLEFWLGRELDSLRPARRSR
ncbi:MAG: hypothetical protein AB7S26_16920 [Sandaracinaceae bacterium]